MYPYGESRRRGDGIADCVNLPTGVGMYRGTGQADARAENLPTGVGMYRSCPDIRKAIRM